MSSSTNGARIAQFVKSLDLDSKDCKFEPHCQRGVCLVWVFNKPLTPNCNAGSQPVDN